MALSVRPARSSRDIEAERRLFEEYREWPAEHREVTAFDDSYLRTGLAPRDREIEGPPGEYARPTAVLGLRT